MSASIKLSFKQYELTVNTVGAEITSFRKNKGSNVLWEKNTSHWNRVAPLLFPIVGKLKDNAYSFLGQNYALSQHGFLREQIFKLANQTENSITLTFLSNPTTKTSYPFDFAFHICYSLNEIGLKVEATVQNTGKSKMFYSYGGHPAFRLNDKLGNYSLRFQKDFVAERQLLSQGLFSGLTEKMTISGKLQLTEDLFQSDAIVFKHPPFQEIELIHKTQGLILTMKCETWSAFGIWTKTGAPFLCLEPWWGWADAINTSGNLIEKTGIRELESGKIDQFTYQIELP